MKLNVIERLMCLQLLPRTGNIGTLKCVARADDMLGLSDEEIKDFEFVNDGAQMKWNAKGQEDTELPLGSEAKKLIIQKLMEMDKKELLEARHISLYDKFIGGEEEKA